ncbi:hypothetical protein [Limnobaculum xujianqingii]|nr:hypothetical protein [Limnobaculum xujianqingii]
MNKTLKKGESVHVICPDGGKIKIKAKRYSEFEFEVPENARYIDIKPNEKKAPDYQ